MGHDNQQQSFSIVRMLIGLLLVMPVLLIFWLIVATLINGTLNTIAYTGKVLRIFDFVEAEDLITFDPVTDVDIFLPVAGRYAVIQPTEGVLILTVQGESPEIEVWTQRKPQAAFYDEDSLTPGYHRYTFEIESPGRYAIIVTSDYREPLTIVPLIGEQNRLRLALITFGLAFGLIGLGYWWINRGYRTSDTALAEERAARLRQFLEKEKSRD